jgi:hypothetical protein
MHAWLGPPSSAAGFTTTCVLHTEGPGVPEAFHILCKLSTSHNSLQGQCWSWQLECGRGGVGGRDMASIMLITSTLDGQCALPVLSFPCVTGAHKVIYCTWNVIWQAAPRQLYTLLVSWPLASLQPPSQTRPRNCHAVVRLHVVPECLKPCSLHQHCQFFFLRVTGAHQA